MSRRPVTLEPQSLGRLVEFERCCTVLGQKLLIPFILQTVLFCSQLSIDFRSPLANVLSQNVRKIS